MSGMRIFLFLCSALSLLLAAHRFSLAEHTGQNKGALFFLLIGIQLLIAAALIGGHREDRASKSSTSTDMGDSKKGEPSGVNESAEQGKKS
jgi:hypothetical protein